MSGNMHVNGQLHGVSVIESPDPDRSQTFGDAPALYDRFRPSYPRDLMEAVIADTGPVPVLEIGAGTGKATKALLALGKRVHAIEPDSRMAAILELNCGTGRVDLRRTRLEDADLPAESYDLVVAAQSWQWVDGGVSYDLVAETLIANGRLALLWHHPLPRQGLFGQALDQLYSQLAPELVGPLPGSETARFDPETEPAAATTRFRGWRRLEHRWQRDLDAAGLVGWLSTESRHRLLPLEVRAELMTAVAALVGEFGGQVIIDMATVAHLGYRT